MAVVAVAAVTCDGDFGGGGGFGSGGRGGGSSATFNAQRISRSGEDAMRTRRGATMAPLGASRGLPPPRPGKLVAQDVFCIDWRMQGGKGGSGVIQMLAANDVQLKKAVRARPLAPH